MRATVAPRKGFEARRVCAKYLPTTLLLDAKPRLFHQPVEQREGFLAT